MCAIAVLNFSAFANDGSFYGLNPFPAFTKDYIGLTLFMFGVALAIIFSSVSSYIFDKDNKPIALKIKRKNKYLKANDIKRIKHQEFDKYDKYLLTHNYVTKFKNYDCINKFDILSDFQFDKEKLIKYIDKLNNEIDKITIFDKINFKTYKLTTRKEFDKQMELCCKYIINYLNEKNK